MGRRKIKPDLTFAMIQEAVAQAVKHGLAEDIYLPIVFPNGLGITTRELWEGKRAKRTKTKKS